MYHRAVRIMFFTVLLCATAFLPVLAGKGTSAAVSADSTNSVGTVQDSSNALIAKLYIGQKYYDINGVRHDMDVAPYIKDERTFLPVRFAAYAVGVADDGITWDDKTRTVTIVKGSDTVVLVIGSTNMKINGKDTLMDVAPEITADRTMLPFRFVGEALGAKVDWDQETRTVTLTMGDTSTPVEPSIVTPIPAPVSGQINMTAAINGTLQPPAEAVATPEEWGFAPQARRIAFKVGERTATLTGLDGSTRPFDLGTVPMVVVAKESNADGIISHFPDIYKIGATVKVDPNGPVGALYAPFIPIAEAFGVPPANIRWDGEHLAVFGYYGNANNYRVLTLGSRDVICKVTGNNPAVVVSHSEFPLCVLDGQPAMGVTSVSDFWAMLFATHGSPNLIDAIGSGDGWNYETGTAAEGCLP